MVKNHLKRLNAPKSWPIKRKETVFIIRPNPGAHSFKNGMPLSIALRELLKHAKTQREVKHILFNKEVLVDGNRRKDIAHNVGLMDVISIPEIKESYRILLNKKGILTAIAVNDKESTTKICKITGKSLVKGKTQLNCHDAKNILVDKDEYKVGDSLQIELPSQKIIEHIKLEKGNTVFLTGGKHTGIYGTIDSIQNNKITFKTQDNQVFETLKKFAFVIGKEKPLITLE